MRAQLTRANSGDADTGTMANYTEGNAKDIHGLIQSVKKRDRAEREVLERFLHQCKRANFDYFGQMGLAEFEAWNDRRVAALGLI